MESSRELEAYNSKRLGGENSFRTILKAFSKKRSLRSYVTKPCGKYHGWLANGLGM